MTSATAINPEEIEAALAWWRAAGVDQTFDDDATVWLASENTKQTEATLEQELSASTARQQAEKQPRAELDSQNNQSPADLLGDDPPQSLESFREWWLNAPELDLIGPRGRIAPRGLAGAELMVLVVDPEQHDEERLLSGPQGQFLDAILTAMGLSEEQAYMASALTRHTPMADTRAAAQSGLSAVLQHHIALAAPKRVLALGSNILPILGNESPQNPKTLREINPSAGNTPLLLSEGLDSLMASPRLKARFWRRWIEWSAE